MVTASLYILPIRPNPDKLQTNRIILKGFNYVLSTVDLAKTSQATLNGRFVRNFVPAVDEYTTGAKETVVFFYSSLLSVALTIYTTVPVFSEYVWLSRGYQTLKSAFPFSFTSLKISLEFLMKLQGFVQCFVYI